MSEYKCAICGMPIRSIMMGVGDGTGQKFAHESCYWRDKYEKSVEDLKYINKEYDKMAREYLAFIRHQKESIDNYNEKLRALIGNM